MTERRRWNWRRDLEDGVEERVSEGGVYILIVGTALALLFTWLTLQNLPYAEAIANARREYILRIALVMYYLSWVAGTKFDLTTQKSVYLLDPNRAQSRIPSITVVGSILVAFAILLWVKDEDPKFVLALSVLVAVNVVSWRFFLRDIVNPIITATREIYRGERDYFGLERLRVIEGYIGGDWQWRRFAVMAGMMLIASVLVAFSPLRTSLADLLNRLYPSLPAEKVSPLLTAAFLAIFVLVAEGWIWIMRIRTRLSLQLLAVLDSRYRLLPLGSDTGGAITKPATGVADLDKKPVGKKPKAKRRARS